MKKQFSILKIIILTIITGGLYGAYWIMMNLFSDGEETEMKDPEKEAREAGNTLALTWLHFITR